MKDSLLDVATAIRLSRAVVRNIRMNLFWAFFYNVLGIPVAAGALYPAFKLLLSPMIGSAAMSLSSLCVVTNALRLRLFRDTENERSMADVQESSETDKTQSITDETKGEYNMKKVLTVEGMMCAHCEAHVKKALAGVEGVAEVAVELQTKKATVTLVKEVSDKALADAVTEAGYTVTGCVTEK